MDLEALENNIYIGTDIGYIDYNTDIKTDTTIYIDYSNDNTTLTSLDFNELSDSSKEYINKLIDERLKFIKKEKKYKVVYGKEDD